MSVTNSISIKEEAGVTTSNYPIQLGRIFSFGEITNYPQIVISGSSITTQTDIKSRWADNSVKHAILTFYIPTLSANNTVLCTFQNQVSGNNVGYQTKSQMLSASYNFDANIILTSGTSISASARSMVNSDKFSYWTSGTISTSIIVVDHTSACVYDMGFDSYHSFRPMFCVTFWPLINKVKVRYVGEIANSEKLQDMGYSLRLTTGSSSVSSVYTKTAFVHPALTRWTKEYWIGNSPSEISINHNLAYLAESKAVFNWDTTKTVSQTQINTDYTNWVNSSKDLYDSAFWTKNQGDTGGRPDIAPIPGWYIRWIYTGDVKYQRITFGLSELAAAWPIHIREGNPTKNIQGSINGLGKVVSIRNRPTLVTPDLLYNQTDTVDKVVFVSAAGGNSWGPDLAHMPDTNSLIYLVTGDFYHLEELYFWTSWAAGFPNGAATIYDYGRGPTGSEGAIPDSSQIRGNAWSLRNRVHAAFYSPDSFIEKTYFTTLIDDAIAGWEGKFAISGTQYTGNSVYNWALTHYKGVSAAPPQYQWGIGGTVFAQDGYGIDISVTQQAISQFEQNFMMVALGRANELGYPTSALINYTSRFYINAITAVGYNPYLLANGRIPTTKVPDDPYFQSFAELKSGYYTRAVYEVLFPENAPSPYAHSDSTSYPLADPDGGYDILSCAAMAYISGVGSLEAWNFVSTKILNSSIYNDTPTWALVNRGPLTTSGASNNNNFFYRNHKTINIIFGG